MNSITGELSFNSDKQEILNLLRSRCGPQELRGLAESLLHLADSIDQRWSDQSQPLFQWGGEYRQIERDAFHLARRAKLELKRRALPSSMLPPEVLGEPAWDMLLELFCQFAGGAKVSVKSLTLASRTPSTTGLRTIERLVQADFVERSELESDGRVVLLSLTRKGVISVGRVLQKMV